MRVICDSFPFGDSFQHGLSSPFSNSLKHSFHDLPLQLYVFCVTVCLIICSVPFIILELIVFLLEVLY